MKIWDFIRLAKENYGKEKEWIIEGIYHFDNLNEKQKEILIKHEIKKYYTEHPEEVEQLPEE